MSDERPDLPYDPTPELPDHLRPPADEPLSVERKSELRAQLLSAATADETPASPARRWLVPGLAAAAVLAVVATGVAVASGHDDGGGRSLQPAGGGPHPAPSTASSGTPTSKPTGKPAQAPSTLPRSVQHMTATLSSPQSPSAQSCADAVDELAASTPALGGASVTASRPGDFGATYLYETKSAWVVCDDFAAGDGGAPTLLAWHDKADSYQPTPQTLVLSQNVIGADPTSFRYQYMAAGRDFDGVRAISYAFPDGHTEQAVVGQTGLWSMNYQPTSGPLADPRTNFQTLDPVAVTVVHTAAGGGGTDTFQLDWGSGTCGQTNHGC